MRELLPKHEIPFVERTKGVYSAQFPTARWEKLKLDLICICSFLLALLFFFFLNSGEIGHRNHSSRLRPSNHLLALLPKRTKGSSCQSSASLYTMKGVMIPPMSHMDEQISTPRFLEETDTGPRQELCLGVPHTAGRAVNPPAATHG